MGIFAKVVKTLFGSANDRFVKSVWSGYVPRINELAPSYEQLSDAQLRELTPAFRKRIADGATLDQLLPEAFAAVREAGRRFLNMRHYDVQLIGGIVLHQGKIAEMVTGEGKTLVATLPAYLNALEAKGVHVVTVNDYLAQRDCDWMAPIYRGLGLTVGAIQGNMSSQERQPHYASDITYGTNNEFGFDYLRDNMKPELTSQVQGPHHYAIVDEVDSILIDEARTPLIISGSSHDDAEKYREADRVVRALGQPDRKTLENEYFKVEEKDHRVDLSEAGQQKVSDFLGIENIWGGQHMEWPHLINNALKAHHLYRREKEYDIKDGEVKIVDEFTGRIMEGRRWSDGLHQAIEAKEERDGSGVRIREEQLTLATITLQNYFKLYRKLSGMTGTAMTEAGEFYKIYKLECVEIPTNRRLIRKPFDDLIFGTAPEKYEALVDEISNISTLGRPVLVGTTSIEKSQLISQLLVKRGYERATEPRAEGSKKRHYVLNARVSYDNQYLEADIVAQAGRRMVREGVAESLATYAASATRGSVDDLIAGISGVCKEYRQAPGMVIIATNMAGRGTDILLGGNSGHFFYNHLRGEQAMADMGRKEAEKKAKKSGEEPAAATDLFSDLWRILKEADALPYPMKDPATLFNPKERDGTCRALAEALQATLSLTESWFTGFLKEPGKQLLDGFVDPAIFSNFFADEAKWTATLSELFGRPISAGNDAAFARRFVVDLVRLSIPVDDYIERHLAVRRTRLKAEQGKDSPTDWLEKLSGDPWLGYLQRAEAAVRDCMINRLLVVCPQFFNREELGLDNPEPNVPYWFQAHTSGGLAIVGTERHDSRRIDNQLRGRCGRQGDPGTSQFYLSLDDDLMRMFAGPRVKGILQFAGLKAGQPIQARMVTKSVERAQKRVEQRNFDIRKNLLEYDEVMDRQRKTVYTLRQGVLEGLTRAENPLRYRTLRIKQSVLERLPKEDGKLAYDDWYPWWEEENSHPTPLAEGDQWIPLEDPLRRQHLNRVSWRMLANRISRQVDEYSSPETEAAEWNLDGFCDWFNKEFAAEANPISVADISGLSLGDIRARLAEHILWDKDPAIPAIEADAKDRKKGEMPEYGSKFSDQYGVTLDEGDLANIENLNPKKAPEHFRELYKDRCAHRREQQIGRGRIQEMERQLETFTSGWDLAGLCRWLTQSLRTQLGAADFVGKTRDEAEELIAAKLREDYTKREQVLGDEMMRFIEQYVLLDTIDNRWKDHLREMDYLRNAVAFSGMAQKDPKVEYKIRGLDNFRQMLILVEDNYSDKVMRVRLREEDSLDALGAKWGAGQARKDDAGSAAGGGAGGGGDATAGESRGQFAQAAERNQQGDGPVETIKNEVRRIGPNETCPCGSGRKYKKCHGLPGAGPLPPEVLKKLK